MFDFHRRSFREREFRSSLMIRSIIARVKCSTTFAPARGVPSSRRSHGDHGNIEVTKSRASDSPPRDDGVTYGTAGLCGSA